MRPWLLLAVGFPAFVLGAPSLGSDRPLLAAKPKKLTPAPPPPNPSSFDFDLLAPAKPAAPSLASRELDEKIRRRRKMLEVHQLLGLTSLTCLAATDVVGQLELTDKYGGGGDTGRYFYWHVGLAAATTAAFAAAAILGITAPVPFEKHGGFDTTRFHETMMAIATAGMLIQVGLGFLTHAHEGLLDQRALAETHQIIGYASLGAMTIGALSLTF